MDLTPYDLPAPVLQSLLDLAAGADVLLIGETHGTREVPRLVAALLDPLAALGYGGLGLEMARDQRDALAAWAAGAATPPPPFFAAPWPDGRGNAQALALTRAAAGRGYALLAFDQDVRQPANVWADRDRFMAENLLVQRAALCPQRKIIAVCGDLHSRLTPPAPAEFWPSFAEGLRRRAPDLTVRSLAVVFGSGSFYNYGQRRLRARLAGPADAPRVDRGAGGHDLELHLPAATAASFLAPPQQPGTHLPSIEGIGGPGPEQGKGGGESVTQPAGPYFAALPGHK